MDTIHHSGTTMLGLRFSRSYISELSTQIKLSVGVALCLSLTFVEISQISARDRTCASFSKVEVSSCSYRPLSRLAIKGVRVEVPLLLSQTMWSASSTPLGESVFTDQTSNDQIDYDPRRAFNFQARLGLSVDTRKLYYPFSFSAHYEQDFMSGFFRGGESDAQAIALPLQQNASYNKIRKANARLTLGPFLTIQGGRMTSHWGLGLLANDGAHGWRPESAYFGDPRGGDRVNRLQVATGPWTRQKILLSFALDQVVEDDILLNEDEAKQMIFAAIYGYKKKTQIGAYAVSRTQDIPQVIDGVDRQKQTTVQVYDIYAKTHWPIGERYRLHAELEAVFINGETDLAPSPEFISSDVVQLAIASKWQLKGPMSGGVLDVVYASGDQNFDDGAQNAFRADPNFEMGLLLFRHILTAQSGRAPITASDPNLVGRPNEDLDRFPTRGSVTNTIAVFPRGWVRLGEGFELYGGPLLAWGDVPLADPRNSRFNGGYPVNLLGGQGGRYLGTEVDLGLRYLLYMNGAQLNLGFEGAAFYPGDAFETTGEAMPTVYGGRFMAQARF